MGRAKPELVEGSALAFTLSILVLAQLIRLVFESSRYTYARRGWDLSRVVCHRISQTHPRVLLTSI